MDHLTHVVLAIKMLKSCNCDVGACIYSLLPALDRSPPYYHRMYGHVLKNFPNMLEVALSIYSGRVNQSRDPFYEVERLKAERSYFVDKVAEVSKFLNEPAILQPSSDRKSAALALVSHLYFDMYNNPIQLFLPYSFSCSGQWSFWRSIDYWKFRTKFYKGQAIARFRRNIYVDCIWNVRMEAISLMFAMINRIGELTKPKIDSGVIEISSQEFWKYLKIPCPNIQTKEVEFCRSLEKRINGIISECLKESDEN